MKAIEEEEKNKEEEDAELDKPEIKVTKNETDHQRAKSDVTSFLTPINAD